MARVGRQAASQPIDNSKKREALFCDR